MLKILLVDDHKIMREGLKSLLAKETGMEVIAEAENGRMAVQLVRKLKPDVVVMDINMPDLNGIEATCQIMAESPDTKVIGLSMHSDRRFVSGMLKSGATGYLLKDCAFEELASAIQSVAANQTYLSPRVTGTVVQDYVHHLSAEEKPDAPTLTPREREVLQLIAEGKKTKEIAGLLNVSVKTVETHRRHIMEKLDIRSIAELTKFAIREGMTFLES